MKRSKRESRKLNELLRYLENFEEQFPNRGFQLSIEAVIWHFNIKYDEFPIMKKLVIDPKAISGTTEYMKFRWM